MLVVLSFFLFFFFNDTATTEIYTLSLHDALPISHEEARLLNRVEDACVVATASSNTATKDTVLASVTTQASDRKSTRLNSSHGYISYAVFCLKKKKKNTDRSKYDN